MSWAQCGKTDCWLNMDRVTYLSIERRGPTWQIIADLDAEDEAHAWLADFDDIEDARAALLTLMETLR